MALTCKVPECTFADTKICVRGNTPADACSNLLISSGEDAGELPTQTAAAIIDLPPSPSTPSFKGGFELGIADANAQLAQRYGHIVGILGAPKAGKTAALISLYLLLSRAMLPGYRFLDSRTLMAFEGLARGARVWNQGEVPDEICGHTTLADPRHPGFLHLRIADDNKNARRDLLLPDLPGEWTDELATKNEVARLRFLRSADSLWFVFNGQQLLSQLQSSVRRLELLLKRLGEAGLTRSNIPLIVVATHSDQLAGSLDAAWDAVQAVAQLRNLTIETIGIASLSEHEEIQPGHGIQRLLDATFARTASAVPSRVLPLPSARQILQYRRGA